MRRLLQLFFMIGCLTAWEASGQTVTVSGTVKDASDGSTIPGATVFDASDQTNGVVTDIDGNFTLRLTGANPSITVKFIGYKDQTVAVNGRTTIDFSMEIDVAELEEVVVVGYGEQKKVNLTGSVQTVEFKDAVNQPVTNSGQLLYGRFSGVQLTQGSGLPGNDGSSIVIRGVGTFGSSTPLLVIDNIQYDGLAAFNNLAPSDIASVTVLKDASASAIYGARGANGVIVVTTKRGDKDKFQVTYNSFFGSQSATVAPKFLNAMDYANLINEKFENEANGGNFNPRYTPEQLAAIEDGSLPDQFANTNWTDAVLTEAPITNHNISFSGGNEKSTYRVSVGYLKQESIVKSKFQSERYNLSMNLNSNPKDWLSISNVFNAYWRHNLGPVGGANALDGDNGIIYSFQRTAPTIPLFLTNGDYGYVDGAYFNANASKITNNPLERGFFGNYKEDNLNISERLGLTITIIEGLKFETSGSVNFVTGQTSNYTPSFYRRDFNGDVQAFSSTGTLTNETAFSYRLLNENVIRYNKDINDHSFGVLLGQAITFDRSDGFSASLGGFPVDELEEFNGGGVLNPSASGGANNETWLSYFGRINYNFKGKYLAEFNLRRDGSSKFPPSLLYGVFPSASVGWRISDETFFPETGVINIVKLRASWGVTGNDRIGSNLFRSLYTLNNVDYVLGNDIIYPGAAITTLANSNAHWEEVQQLNIGLDVGLLDNKLEVTADYFKKSSSDILYSNFPVPSSIGFSSAGAINAASMVNTGLEVAINYRNQTSLLQYSAGLNLTKFFNNEVTDLGDGGLETITNTDIIRIGDPLYAYFGYQALGIFQTIDEVAASPKQFGNNFTAPGDIRYADINNDGVVDDEDRIVIGNPYPSLLYNFTGNVSAKGFDLSVLLQGVYNVDRLIMGNGQLPMEDDRSNVLDYWINRWTPENPSKYLPRIGGQDNDKVSTFYVRDASYLRLKNIELGYTLPVDLTKKAAIQNLRVFVGGQNLLTFTKVGDFDPERNTGRNSNRSAPLYKTVTIGVNAKF